MLVVKLDITCLKLPLKKMTKHRFSRQIIALCRPKVSQNILPTFNKLPFDIKIFVLSISKMSFKTGFTVQKNT